MANRGSRAVPVAIWFRKRRYDTKICAVSMTRRQTGSSFGDTTLSNAPLCARRSRRESTKPTATVFELDGAARPMQSTATYRTRLPDDNRLST